ncbi:SPOR domain-containing protein [Palleronia pelagia]|uniref:Sporulation related domain-containing protein n=1 Tax=Palleronia pelagia TaxID=387096 RepID=A0A1H8IAU3_9RHOB|nr:SPOR domain-containing protein [Palleronia pelagia]SEN65890.1 Sporulation related domain-containing protein [Palleronia pelagia]
MAEIDYLEDYGVSESAVMGAGHSFGKWANISGAVVSLALIAGLSVWGYKLLMRDVTGVPVVQAMEGAFRVAPEDPGGMRTPHQGLSVNEIAAVGEAGGPAEEVTLAPPPMALDEEEDRPVAVLSRMAEADTQADEGETADLAAATEMVEDAWPGEFLPEDDGAQDDIAEDGSQDALATDRAVAEALGIPAPDEDLAGFEEDGSDEGTEIALADGAALDDFSSPRPPQRPADLSTSVAPSNVSTVAADPVAGQPGGEISVDDLAIGTRLVQLGAFGDPEIAREQWVEIAGRFPDYFEGKRRVVQRAESGGKIFYRLRAEGFDDLADTRRFCTALVAGSADCIPVELR